MDLLLADQSNEGLVVIRIKNQNGRIKLNCKNNCGIGKNSGILQQILLFKFKGKHYIALAKKSGLVQLYENSTLPRSKKNFKLTKEWKHSNLGSSDSIMSMKFINKQYLFTCSSKGKIVIRDLINDDSSDGYSIYLIEKPVSCVETTNFKTGRITIMSAGMNSQPKIYDLEIGSAELENDSKENLQNFYKASSESVQQSEINLVDRTPDIGMSLRRRFASFNVNYSYDRKYIHHLTAKWEAGTISKKHKDTRMHLESANWIVSLLSLSPESDIIIAGTQYGDLIIYNTEESIEPKTIINVSSFPIIGLQSLNNGQYVMFVDFMSKIGIFKVSNLTVQSTYDDLHIGPISCCKLIRAEHESHTERKTSDHSEIAVFSPVFIISWSIDYKLSICKLFDDSSYQLVTPIQTDMLARSIELLDNDLLYLQLNSLFDTSANASFTRNKNARI